MSEGSGEEGVLQCPGFARADQEPAAFSRRVSLICSEMTSRPLRYQHQPWNESCFPRAAFKFEKSAHAGGCEHGALIKFIPIDSIEPYHDPVLI
mgnify:FL=1